MKKIKLKKRSKRKNFFLFSSLSIAAISSVTLASCSSISTNLIKKTVTKANGDLFATNYDLNTITKKAFENNSAQKSYLSSIVNNLILSWIKTTANDGKNISFKKALDAQIKTVNDEFNNVRKSSQENNAENFPLVFQQNELDANGGTEEAWKENKMLSWANTFFQGKIFEKDFLTLLDSQKKPITSPSKQSIVDAINNTNYSFGFSPDAFNQNLAKNDILDPLFANFQKFVFDQWVQTENPFVINMSLWKYGTPQDGIQSVYLPKVSSGDSTNSTGTYAFPYFSNNATATNDNGGTIDKFTKFINDASSKKGFVTNDTLGLREIPKFYTDDSSTFILAKNSSIYNDLYIEFAAAASYLLYEGPNPTSANKGLTNIRNDLNVTSISTTSTNGVDPITSNFVKNSSINKREIKLSNALVKEIINPTGEFKQLINDTNNQSSEIFITDTITTTSSGLENFIFIRNEAGVHAVAIDGKKHLDTAADVQTYKKKAADIVLYHYFLNKNGYSDFQIDIKSEIKNFLTNNFDYLIWKYATDSSVPSNLQLFSPVANFGNSTVNFIHLLNKYLFDITKYNKVNEYQDKMFSAKSKFASNYGVLAKDNGLAAPWVYDYITNSTNFELTKTVDIVNDPFSNNGSKKMFNDAINAFVNQLQLAPLQSSFEGFKYSQYILTNNYYVNVLLNSFGSDGNSIGNEIKSDILKDYLEGYVDFTTLDFKSSLGYNNSTTPGVDHNKNLNNAMINFFFNSTFNSMTDRWSKYTLDSNSQISYENLNKYRKQLWVDANQVETSAASDSMLSLYTLMVTVQYLLKDNAKEFINYLQSKIAVGDDAFIGWSQINNKKLEKSSAKTTNVLDINNLLSKNMNNTYTSSYYGSIPNSTNSITDNILNTTNAIFQNDSNYYNYVASTVGFLGLQTSSNNSFPSIVANQLFTNPSTAAVKDIGLLYGYVSKDQLIKRIENFSLISDVENLAKKLYTKIKTFSIDKVINAVTLENKKMELKNIVNNTSYINDQMFQPRTGYISSDNILTKKDSPLIQSPNSANIEYATKTIQLNNNDVNSIGNFWTAISKLPDIDENKKSEIFFNLLVQVAKDTIIQDNVINLISNEDRVDVYDVRLNNQLGPRWVKNWK